MRNKARDGQIYHRARQYLKNNSKITAPQMRCIMHLRGCKFLPCRYIIPNSTVLYGAYCRLCRAVNSAVLPYKSFALALYVN